MDESEENSEFVESLYEKVKKRIRMKEIAGEMLGNAEYLAAHQILHKLLRLQDDVGDRVESLFQIAECDIMLHRKIAPETHRQIMNCLEECGYSFDEVHQMAQQRNNSLNVIIDLYACKLSKTERNANLAVSRIQSCVKTATDMVEAMWKDPKRKKEASKIALLPAEMIDQLREIQGADPDKKVHALAKTLNWICYTLSALDRDHEGIKYVKEGRQIMADYYGSDAPKYKIYATLAHNLAAVLHEESEYTEAMYYREKAVSEVQMAVDISEAERKEDLATYMGGHRLTSGQVTKSRIKPTGPKEDLGFRMKATNTERSEDVPLPSKYHHFKGPVVKEQKLHENIGFQPNPGVAVKELNKTQRGDLVDVGGGIYVNHRKPLRDGYQVFQGKWRSEDVAVKKIEYSDEHCREVEIMRNMEKHTNTVQYKAWTKWESKEMPGIKAIYLAMELCDEKTLHEMAKDDGFTFEERITSLLQFTRGLCHIHSHNVIHGDLKPHNLLLSRNERVVKVGDFGISKKLEWGRTHLTITASIAGTLGWMAPDLKLSPKSDMFSAGLIYFYILSRGKPLEVDRDSNKLTCAHADIAMDLINRMTDPDPGKRPTAKECSKSPLFWDVKKKAQFICDMSNHLFRMPENAEVIKQVDEDSCNIVGKCWTDKLILEDKQVKMSHGDTNYEVVYQKAVEVNNLSTVSSLMAFIQTCFATGSDADSRLRDIFRDKADVWKYFDARFPALFFRIHKLAQKCGYFWSTEEKLQFLSKCDKEIDIRVKSIFYVSWLENLILDKERVKEIQEKVTDSGDQYRISKYSVYNRSVANDRIEEGVYDENSLHSLLSFIKNRQKYFKEDGRLAKWIFGNDSKGILDFFTQRFPNLLDDLVLSECDLLESNEPVITL